MSSKGPRLFSDIGQQSRDLLNRDFTSDQRITINSCSVTKDSGDISTESSVSTKPETAERVKDSDDKEKSKDLDKEKGKEKDNDKKGENEKENLRNLEGTSLDALLQRLQVV